MRSPELWDRLFLVAMGSGLIAAALSPGESALGHGYKLLYLHLPLLSLSLGSFFLASLLAVMALRSPHRSPQALAAVLLGLLFGVGNLLVGELFALLAWGGVTFSEPRFLFSVLTLAFYAPYLPIHWAGERRLTAVFALLALLSSLGAYRLLLLETPSHLHPSRVAMPLSMAFPLLPAALAGLALYLSLFSRLQKLFESGRREEEGG
jgi:hypothetical protein